MTTPEALLAQGIAAAKAGDKGSARRLLTQVVRLQPESEAGWLWLSAVLDTPQAKAFCLRQVLAFDPDNRAARKGLAALETSPALVSVARPSPVTPPPAAKARHPPTPNAFARLVLALGALVRRLPMPSARSIRVSLNRGLSSLAARLRRLPSFRRLVGHPLFWPVTSMCLAVIALSLVGVLAYAVLTEPSAAKEAALAAVVPSATPWPRGTLRPTFTATPTQTPTATHTPTPTQTFTPTSSPTPTATPTSTSTPISRAARRSPTGPPPPTPPPRPTLPPRSLDPRLAQLGVHLEPAFVGTGQPYWRLVQAHWTDARESAGKHSIYVEALDLSGRRAVGQPVVVQWAGGNLILPIADVPLPDWGMNFPMYNTLGSYSVSVGGAPSDSLVGLGLGTIENPGFTVHTSFYLTFRLVLR